MARMTQLLFGLLLSGLLAACGGGASSAPASSSKSLSAFSLEGVAGTINETGKTIAVTMPFGPDVTALVATFSTSGASVKVGATTQVSGTTANDFTNPVTYTVTAADGSTADYTVTVAVAPSTAKALTAYSLGGVIGTINETAKTIAATMPFGTDVTALVATFTTTGASVKVGATTQVSGTTANDFTNPVTYTVTAADGSTADYAVTVAVAPSTAKSLSAFSLAGVDGSLNEIAKTISVTLPFGTDVTALVATFTTTGASVEVGATTQISGTTANDFTNPVTYTVIAADGSTADYVVSVAVAPSTAKALSAFSLEGVAGTIDETAKTIAVTMPFGTDVTTLVATFTTTGASVKVGATTQISGTTANDFTNPVTYTVTAAGGSTANYTATVTVATAITHISAGSNHTVVLKADGSLWAWGSNLFGQLGDGATYWGSSVPKQIDIGYAAIAVGNDHTVALKTDGSLWAWGWNDFGQLGDGATYWGGLVPKQIGTGFTGVAAGDYDTFALKADGSLWAWGYNLYGQLGDGTTTNSLVPKQIGTGYAAIASGFYHTVALKTDGSLWAWGLNLNGQLGDGTTTDSLVPKQIGTGYIAVAAGGYSTSALSADGSLWTWGAGYLGDGFTYNTSYIPKQIGTGYTAIAAGTYHTVALKSDGSLWAWGYNAYGQLGDGTKTDSLVPKQIGTGYTAIAAGGFHTVALKVDGLWAWGHNTYGQIGDSTTTDKLVPTLINIP